MDNILAKRINIETKTKNMKIEFRVIREVFTEKRTLGKMYVNGEYLCDTLEDKDRHLETTGQSAKVYAKTAIPRGKYKMVYYLWQRYNNWYPWIQNVPYFQGILIVMNFI